MNEEEEKILEDINQLDYTEQDAKELLKELENDTGNYSNYDLAMAIIFYKNLYKQAKEKNNRLQEYIKENEIYKTNLFKSYEKEQEKSEKLEEQLDLYIVYTKQNDLNNFDLFMKQNYISKNKIKAKIEELEKQYVNLPIEHMKQAQIKVLQELLEE